MQTALNPSLETLNKSLARLESVVVGKLEKLKFTAEEPQLGLKRDEREVNRRVAARLDQTISRLETLLAEEA